MFFQTPTRLAAFLLLSLLHLTWCSPSKRLNERTVRADAPITAEEKQRIPPGYRDPDVERGKYEEVKESEKLADLAGTKDDFAPTNYDEGAMADKIAAAKPAAKKNGKKNGRISPARRLKTRKTFHFLAPELLSRYEGNALKPLPFRSQDISVVIAGHRARVVLDLVFENPTDEQLSGTLNLELPDGAVPTYLGMFQGKGAATEKNLPAILPPSGGPAARLLGRRVQPAATYAVQGAKLDWGELRAAVVVNPVRGRRVYERTVRKRVDPALSEWAGANKFTTRVFPIPARSFKRLVFAYDRPVEMRAGSVEYRFDLPEKSPRETRLSVHDLGLHGRSKLTLNGRKKQPEGTAGGKLWVLRKPPAKSSLRFSAVPRRTGILAIAGRDEQVPGTLVHMLFQPKLPPAPAKSAPTGRAVFLLDTSYSGKKALYQHSARLLRQVLEHDTSLTHFSVIAFDVGARSLTGGFAPNTPASRAKLWRNIEKIELEGATNFAGALEYLRQRDESKKADAYFLLSDGQINWGAENPAALRRRYRDLFKQRWICYRAGQAAVNGPLFQALARDKGRVVSIAPGQDLRTAALAHRKTGFRLEAVRAEGDPVQGKGEPEISLAGDPRWIYPGQLLEIAARLPDKSRELKLAVRINGREQKINVPVRVNRTAGPIAGRAWANLYANRLLNLRDKEGDRIALALSQRFSLTNRVASFLILETDQEYKQHKLEWGPLNLAQAIRKAREGAQGGAAAVAGADRLSPDRRRFVAMLKELPPTPVWRTGRAPSLQVDMTRGHAGEDHPTALYEAASDFYRKRNAGAALRTLSTIVELKPRDDQALRLTGFVLLEWKLFDAAADIFARSRARRPFEPQNYLLEAMAQAAAGRLHQAALRYEIVINGAGFAARYREYAKASALKLYEDLLTTVIADHPRSPAAAMARKILKQYKAEKKAARPAGRLLLFWNIDDTDVDLHVREEDGTEVYYENKTSPGGGRLFWDNTDGLGPELYEHPRLGRKGFQVQVNYFDSSSAEGAAPATTCVAAFQYGKDRPSMRLYTTVLSGKKSEKVQIMPRWKRE